MAGHDQDLVPATAADIAADMEAHRRTYAGFMKLLMWVCIGSGILLIVVFLLLLGVDVQRVPGGDAPPMPPAPMTE